MARNPGGTVSGFKLLSTPDAPTIDSVTTSIGSASVAFTAPTDVGDAAVSSYVVTAVDESSGASTGATGSASPITVTPPAGGTFKIRMQALNAYGPGRLTEYDTGNVIYDGALYAWGLGEDGRLGLNDTTNRSSPVQVGALNDWLSVSARGFHTSSIKTNGTLWGWGFNAYGRLGDGTTVNKSSPVQIGALTNWSQVSAGAQNTGAVKTDGTLWIWGRNSDGQLGNPALAFFNHRSSPVQVGALTNWAVVAVGTSQNKNNQNSVFAVKTDGTLWAWGANGNGGRLGLNDVAARSSPVQVGALTDWSRVSPGDRFTTAVKTNGTLWSWGYNVSFGELGQNNLTNRSSPVQVGALTNWSQVSAGSFHALATKTDGTLWAWGRNFSGPLGDGTVINRSSPVQIGALTNWSQVAAGYLRSVSIKTDGTLWAWGSGADGQLGDGTVTGKSSPVQVGAETTWVSVSGWQHTTALYGVV